MHRASKPIAYLDLVEAVQVRADGTDQAGFPLLPDALKQSLVGIHRTGRSSLFSSTG
jgi:hypothetical protein